MQFTSHAIMSNTDTIVTYTLMALVFIVVIVIVLCAIKLSFRPPSEVHRIFNKYIVPGFPCHGTLFILARDGVLYVVPEGKAVIKKSEMVYEVHRGHVARSCNQQGIFSYFDDDEERHDQYDGQNHAHDDWEVGSVLSQDMTLSVTDDEYHASSPRPTSLAGERF